MYPRRSADTETIALGASYNQSPGNDVECVQERKHLRVKSHNGEGARCGVYIGDYSR